MALPIFENSSLEEDSEIQQLWNHLLANAMDPSFNNEIRYGFIDMIKGITGKEARILSELYSALERNKRTTPLSGFYQYAFYKEGLIEELSMSADDYAVSANNLMRMKFDCPAVFRGAISFGFGKAHGLRSFIVAFSPVSNPPIQRIPFVFYGCKRNRQKCQCKVEMSYS